ncbi:MAG: hypothetical protein ABH857_03140 [Elusimicrobiota bacterium]
MKRTKIYSYFQNDSIPIILISACIVYLLGLSWLKWGSLIIDTGREVYAAYSLTKGNILYKDIQYLYGPLTHYLNALFCLIFGIHLKSFIISGLVCVCGVCILLYKLAAIYLNKLLAALIVIIFLFVFAFGQYYEAGIFNYILPYSYSATYCVLFSLTALFFYYKSNFAVNIYSYLTSLSLFLVFATRIEIGLFLLIAIITGVIINYKVKGNKKEIISLFAAYLLLPAIACFMVYALFSVAAQNENVVSTGIFSILKKNLDLDATFTSYVMGITDFGNNIRDIFLACVYYSAVTAAFYWAVIIIQKVMDRKKHFIAALIFVASFITGFVFSKYLLYGNMQYKPVQIICLILIALCYLKFKKDPSDTRSLFLLAFAVFSLLMLLRIFFRVWPGHYGMYLLVPGMLCYSIFFFNIFPAKFIKNGKNIYLILTAVFFIFLAYSQVTISMFAYSQRLLSVNSWRGSIIVNPSFLRYKNLLEYLVAVSDPSDSLVVFPEGVMLNFLSERDTPLYNYSFLPIDFAEPGFERKIVNDLEKNKVKYIAILRRDTTEYGAAAFLFDYGLEIRKYLEVNYTIDREFGPFPFTSNEFSAVLLKRIE